MSQATLDTALRDLAGHTATLRLIAEAVELVQRLALTDELTGLGNKRALNEAYNTAVVESDPWTVAFGDLTGFKDINDKHGHHVGDAAIAHAGRWLSSVSNAHGLLAFRQSGDEFVVLGPSSKMKAALADLAAGPSPMPPLQSEQLGLTTESGLTLTTQLGDVIVMLPEAEAPSIVVRVSFGLAEVDGEDAIHRAEHACGRAKEEGKPIVEWAPGAERRFVSVRWRCESCNASIKLECPESKSSEVCCPVCRVDKPSS